MHKKAIQSKKIGWIYTVPLIIKGKLHVSFLFCWTLVIRGRIESQLSKCLQKQKTLLFWENFCPQLLNPQSGSNVKSVHLSSSPIIFLNYIFHSAALKHDCFNTARIKIQTSGVKSFSHKTRDCWGIILVKSEVPISPERICSGCNHFNIRSW